MRVLSCVAGVCMAYRGGAGVKLYGAERAAGCRVIRSVSLAVAVRKVEKGVWRWATADGETVAQIVGSGETRGDRDVPTMRSSASISASEMELIAAAQTFPGDRSRTYGLSEDRRQERVAAGLPPEDRAERVLAKEALWPKLQNVEPGLRIVPAALPMENYFLRLDDMESAAAALATEL